MGTPDESASSSSILNNFSLFNVQGLKPLTVVSSVEYVRDVLYEKKQLFIALTETWLNEHTDAELKIDGYRLFRCDRQRKRKRGRASGGVCIYVREDIAVDFKIKTHFSNGVNELLIIHSEELNLLISVLYRQPDDSTHGHPSGPKEMSTIVNKLKWVLDRFKGKAPDILLCGDFNLPHIDWNTLNIKSTPEREMLLSLLDLATEFQLVQCIKKPTHRCGNTLDLLFTNNQDIIHNYNCIPVSSSISHHCLIEFATHLHVKTSTEFEKRPLHTPFDIFNYFDETINWDVINQNLENLNWEELLCLRTPEDQIKIILDKLIEVSDKLIPKKNIINNNNKNKYRIPR